MMESLGWENPGWLPEGGDIEAKLKGVNYVREESRQEWSTQVGQQRRRPGEEGSHSQPLSGSKR